MSEPSPEPISRRAARRAERGMRRETRRNIREGRKTLKAAYALAARDVKRMDPTVRERIGRANMTSAELQNLANSAMRADFQPGRFNASSQQARDDAADRMQRAGTSAAPTRNPFRQVANRVSRWRNTRQGTKALKAAFTQAARDAKRMDPAVLGAIGRSGINRHDLSAVAQARFDQVFRPEGRFGALPSQQAGQAQQVGQQLGPQRGQQIGQQVGQQLGQLAQPGQQLSVPQQIGQLQQMIEAKQAQVQQLLAQMNELQTQMQQVIEARKAELRAEYGQLNALQNGQQIQQNGPQVQQNGQDAQRPQTPENQRNVGFHPVVPTDPAAASQEQPGTDQSRAEQSVAEQNGATQTGPEQTGATQTGPEQNGAEQNGPEQHGADQPAQSGPEQTSEVRRPELDGEWMDVATGNAEPEHQEIPPAAQQSEPGERPQVAAQTGEHQPAQHQTSERPTSPQQTGPQQTGPQQNGPQRTGEQQIGEQLSIPGLQIPDQQNGEHQPGQDQGNEQQTPAAANLAASGLNNPAYKSKADLAKGFDVAFGGLRDAGPSSINDARRTAGSADTERNQQQHRTDRTTGTQKDQPTRGGS